MLLSVMERNIHHISATSVDKDNNIQNWVSFNASQGSRMSANEHLVPEQFFNDPNATTKNVQGISAVKAIQIAASQGQKIYQINSSNISTVLPKLNHHSETISDIRSAVAAGKIVTISESKVTVSGWSGSGYIILDPSTGAGAYMIGGGADGGIVLDFDWKVFGLVVAIGIFLILAYILPMILAALAFFVAIGLAGCLIGYITGDSDDASQGIYTAQFLTIFFLGFLVSKAENLTPQGMARIGMGVSALDYVLSSLFNYADLDEWCAAK